MAALLDRLDAARAPVEAQIAAALQRPYADVWREEAALRALLAPREPALRALLDSADFAYYWTVRCLIPLRRHLVAAELDRLQPIAMLNGILEQWLWGAAAAGLKRVRGAACRASAAVAEREHSDNMTKELFCAIADQYGLTAATEELGAVVVHAERVAPEGAEVAAARRWLALEPWQHLARCTLARVHGEKRMISVALERAASRINALHLVYEEMMGKSSTATNATAYFAEFKDAVKEVLHETHPYRKIIRERRTSWFARKLHIIEINITAGPTVADWEPTAAAWTATCADIFATEGFSVAIMADCSEGARRVPRMQNTLRMAHEDDPAILACEDILQGIDKINTLSKFKTWVSRAYKQA